MRISIQVLRPFRHPKSLVMLQVDQVVKVHDDSALWFSFWSRRLRDGDVALVQQAAAEEKPKRVSRKKAEEKQVSE